MLKHLYHLKDGSSGVIAGKERETDATKVPCKPLVFKCCVSDERSLGSLGSLVKL